MKTNNYFSKMAVEENFFGIRYEEEEIIVGGDVARDMAGIGIMSTDGCFVEPYRFSTDSTLCKTSERTKVWK